jgi:hypothetical protein
MSDGIWKFRITVGAMCAVDMPAGARVLHFASQFGDSMVLQIWAQVDRSAAVERRLFVIVGTGHDVPAGAKYIGTAITLKGSLVWHLFELAESPVQIQEVL